jgi:hypothetical protein
MTKAFKTRGELQELVLDEARKTGKCADAPDIIITGPFPSREFTWDIMKRPGGTSIPPDCATELNRIVRRLQMVFELSGD